MAEERKIEAQIKDIKVTPAHFDKHGEIDRDEYATVTLNVPMDTIKSRAWVANLLNYLSTEYVAVEIISNQEELPGMEASSGSKSATLTAEDAQNQMKTAKEVAEAAN